MFGGRSHVHLGARQFHTNQNNSLIAVGRSPVNETQKTGIFAAVAAVTVLLAFLTRPVTVTKQDESELAKAGDVLFKDETADMTKAASLKITKFDENKMSMDTFEIVRDKQTQLWRIPSASNYPADADEQLKNATSPLAGLKILDVIRDATPSDHSLYGVIEPTDKLEAGVTGVGTLVSVADASGKAMASLVIGKKDKNNEQLHYVRIPNQDPVYSVEIDTSAFTTDFKKWIKPDLLNVKSFDIVGIGIRDYQTQQIPGPKGIQVALGQSMEADASYDTAKSKWNLDRLLEFDGPNGKEVTLNDSEELKGDKLNALRTAAQSLQIVGVRPKPKGLAADLKADKALLENEESMMSLLDQGFVPYTKANATEILANAGETLLTTKDGVRYTLRFGEEVLSSGAVQTSADDKAADAPASTRERYLLVTASLDESKFPPPDLQAVPETIEDLKKMDAEKAAAEEARKAAIEQANKPNQPPAQPKLESPEAAKPEEAKPEEAKPAEPKPAEAKPEEAKAEEPKSDAAQPDAAKPAEPKNDEPKVEEPKDAEPATETCADPSLELDAQEAQESEEPKLGTTNLQKPNLQKPNLQKPSQPTISRQVISRRKPSQLMLSQLMPNPPKPSRPIRKRRQPMKSSRIA